METKVNGEHAQQVNLFKALAKLQAAVVGVPKDAENTHFKNLYATLESVVSTIRPHMREVGLCFTQMPGRLEDKVVPITTTIIHVETGESLSSTLTVPVAKMDAQGLGSAITYGCRYALMAMLGLPPIDDDAEGSIDRSGGRKAQPSQRPAAKKAPAESHAVMAFKAIMKQHKVSPTVLFQMLRKEAMAQIEEVSIRNQAQLDEFLANQDGEVIDGWCQLFDEMEAEFTKQGCWADKLREYDPSRKESAA